MTDPTFHRLVAKLVIVAPAISQRMRTGMTRSARYFKHCERYTRAQTSQELLMALEAAETELHEEVERLGGWREGMPRTLGITPKIEAWIELAKLRIFDLGETRLSVE